MKDRLKNYIEYNDNKIKDAIEKRDKNKRTNFNAMLSDNQKKKILLVLTYIKKNPTKALENKNLINMKIKEILSKK